MLVDGQTSLLAGWIGIVGGVISGSVIGLFFHADGWAGGYGAFMRRMLRLGHISFFGIGLLNIALGVTASLVSIPADHVRVAVIAMIIGAITMPLLCFLTAWRKPFRHLFFVPVLSVLLAAAAVLAGWPL